MDDINEIIHCDKDSCGLYIHSLVRKNSGITWNDILEILDLREDKFTRDELKERKLLFYTHKYDSKDKTSSVSGLTNTATDMAALDKAVKDAGREWTEAKAHAWDCLTHGKSADKLASEYAVNDAYVKLCLEIKKRREFIKDFIKDCQDDKTFLEELKTHK